MNAVENPEETNKFCMIALETPTTWNSPLSRVRLSIKALPSTGS